MQDVLKWIAAAMDAACNDPGNEGDTVTTFSGRCLWVSMLTSPGSLMMEVTTLNFSFSGRAHYIYDRTTVDGAVVIWNERDVGVPTGADWLPQEFIKWMKGSETR